MRCCISVMVDHGGEREVIITNYAFCEGFPAVTNRAPEDCSPGEPDRFEDIEAKWYDTGELLTADEFEMHQEELEQAIITDREGDHGR